MMMMMIVRAEKTIIIYINKLKKTKKEGMNTNTIFKYRLIKIEKKLTSFCIYS